MSRVYMTLCMTSLEVCVSIMHHAIYCTKRRVPFSLDLVLKFHVVVYTVHFYQVFYLEGY